jgi:hypothetical protein
VRMSAVNYGEFEKPTRSTSIEDAKLHCGRRRWVIERGVMDERRATACASRAASRHERSSRFDERCPEQRCRGDLSSYRTFVQSFDALCNAINKITRLPPVILRFNLESVPSWGDTVLPEQKMFFDTVHANASILKALLESKLDLKADEVTELVTFFQANLRRAIYTLPDKEVEIQNAVELLLIGRGYQKGLDYDRETGRVKMSIKEVIPDFIFPRLGLALEVKLSKDKAKSKAIVDEVNADIRAYAQSYAFMVFVIYDLGSIRDETEFKQGLEHDDRVSVVIVKH